MTKHYLDIHILQSLPPSNVNRDDDGRPKTAVFGGTLRSRVSSQAWKRAVRKKFGQLLAPSETAVRTLRAVEALMPLIHERRPGWDLERCQERAIEVITATDIKVEIPKAKKGGEQPIAHTQYFLFLSRHQLERLADLGATDEAVGKREAKAAVNGEHGIEVSLFGRMVADATDLNVDAAVQVAHAISTHAVDQESDYFTAVDDFKEDGDDAGAGMIGYIDFNSSTLYRFATVDVSELARSLGSVEAAAKAARAFVEGFALSMPTGKQNTFANNTLPEALLVQLREGRSTSFVNAFEEAVPRSDSGYLSASAERLAAHIKEAESSFLGEPVRAFLTRASSRSVALEELAPAVSFVELLAGVENSTAEALAV